MPNPRPPGNRDLTPTGQAVADGSIEAIIGGKVKIDSAGCWLYQGFKVGGYGAHNTVGYIHRFVWTTLKGPIPDGMFVHHRCEVRACCNPAHLELMTPGDHASHHASLRACR